MRRPRRGLNHKPGAGAVLALLLGAGCDDWGLKNAPAQPGVESAALDWSVDPCADFYQFACGNWRHWHPVAPTGAAASRFWIAQEYQTALLERIVLDDAAWARGEGTRPDDAATTDPYGRQIGDHYNSCRSSAQQASVPSSSLRTQLEAIDAVTSLRALPEALARLQRDGVMPLLSAGTTPDEGEPTTQILWLGPGARSMDRAHYVDAQHESYRASYLRHIDELTRIAADATELRPVIDPAAVLRIEIALASASPSPEQARDPVGAYHPLSADQLAQEAPQFDWTAYFGAIGIAPPPRVDGPSPDYLRALDQLLQTTPLEDLKSYLRWRLLEAEADGLGWRAHPAEFAFHRTLFDGTISPPPDGWRCFQATHDDLGFAIAHPFLARVFDDPQQRQAASAMVAAITRQMAERLARSSWLDAETRTAALDKLAAVQPMVGFPDQLPSYDLTLHPDDYLQNRILLRNLEWSRRLARLDHPVDRALWTASPIVTNAYYSPQRNAIIFPAAILQPPFFSLRHTPAANYGAIGSIMGHELSHAFDDKGQQYDGRGALRDWWTPSVAQEFQQRAACLVDQYNSYQPLPNQPINGTLTVGENLADLVGLQLALAAFQADDGGAALGAPGFFAPDQQFFIAFAQNWCGNERPEYLTETLREDPHSPGRFRVNGVVRNLPTFGSAFHCPTPAPLSPANRCEIW